MFGELILKDGTKIEGRSFGYGEGSAGELVFATGMAGYPESLTDPSYEGQILVTTYPILGSYGVPDKKNWESGRIHVKGLIVNQYIDTPSHFESKKTLSTWLKEEKIPALEVPDTRYLTQLLRDKGAQLAKIIFDKDISFHDPNIDNLVDQVSVKKPIKYTRRVSLSAKGQSKKKTIVLIDCGVKQNIIRSLINRNADLIVVPWDFDVLKLAEKIDGVVISNGPGDPKMVDTTIVVARKLMDYKIPILGICLGNQILALAAGGNTYKLKFGHRGQNQPCTEVGTKRTFITTQNHGYAIGKIPKGFKPWFINANDHTNEGIIHESMPFMSVQFHPEACPGPVDTEWIFDKFLNFL